MKWKLGSRTVTAIFMCLLFICATLLSKWNDYSQYFETTFERSTENENLAVGELETSMHFRENTTKVGVQDVRKRRLPNAIIAGFAKCGTRALLWFLSNHDMIKAAQPELHFFNKNYEKGLDWYTEQFPPRLESEIGIEKTPAYISDKTSPERVYRMNSSLRIIVIMCDPVRKVISQYTQFLSKASHYKSFERVVLNLGEIDPSRWIVRDGIYVNHVKRWLQWFPFKQLLFVDGDRFKIDPYPELRKVETFLNVPNTIKDDQIVFNKNKGFYCFHNIKNETKCLGEAKGRVHVDVNQTTVQKLKDFYRPYNKMFMDYIDRQFDWDV